MTFHCVFERDSVFLSAANPFRSALGEIQILEISQVLQDGFASIIILGTPGAPSEPLEAFFNGLRKPKLAPASKSVGLRLTCGNLILRSTSELPFEMDRRAPF
jgi:hypothetical protein